MSKGKQERKKTGAKSWGDEIKKTNNGNEKRKNSSQRVSEERLPHNKREVSN